MKLLKSFCLVLLALTTGCLGNAARSGITPGQIDVFGVELHSDVQYRELKGIKGIDEPCLRGYERSFDPLDIVVGYGFDGKIRKITTRNPQTALFGVHPGDAYVVGREKVVRAGFAEAGSPFKFQRADCMLTFLADANKNIFGIIIEVTDQGKE